MANEERKSVTLGPADQQAARTKDNAIGVDDIGLPSDVKPDNATKLEEIQPEPGKTGQKQ